MKLFVYALRDKVANSFRSLNLNENDQLEKRNLAYAVNNDSHMLFVAKDMELHCVGMMDTETGMIDAIVPTRLVCHVDQLIGAERNVNNEI